MILTRLYAYEVFPQKRATAPTIPDGGKIPITSQLRHTLDRISKDNKLPSQTPIVFHVADPKAAKRVNDVRTHITTFAFGLGTRPSKSAEWLSVRLSQCMDERSHPFLFLISCFGEPPTSQVVLWAFPKDEGLAFSKTAKGVKVEVVKDVFNISSNLKKAALFTGQNNDNSFWEGRMVDLQSGRTDLWVERFLACQLSVSGVFGTSILSEHLTIAYRQTTSAEVREELFNAIVGVRTAPVKRTSFLKFANDYLGNNAKSVFLALVPPEQQNMSFDFDRSTFEQKIGIRVFRMADDVIVAAPLPAIHDTLQIHQDQLEYSGTITSEYLKGSARG